MPRPPDLEMTEEAGRDLSSAPNICSSPPSWLDRQRAAPFLKERDVITVPQAPWRGGPGVAQSWVGTGANEEIAPNDLAHALGDDTLATLSQQTGIGREDLLAGLSQHLPDLINQLTPHGRLPSEEEASRML
jgi:YidB-like protein